MIIFRYLAKEVYSIALTATLALFIIFVSNQFIHFLYYAADGRLTAHLAMSLLLLKAPELLGTLLPLSLFLAILLAYGRMYADNEMTVLFTCGVSRAQLFKITMSFSAIVAVLSGVLMVWISPHGNKRLENLFSKGAASPIELISPGRFQGVDNDRWIFYAANVSRDHKKLYNVFVTEQPNARQESSEGKILVAKAAYQKFDKKTGDLFMVFNKGNRYIGTPGQKNYQIVNFDQYWVRIKQNQNPVDYSKHATASSVLWGDHNNDAVAELQWRFSMPIMAIVLTILAVPLSRVKTKHGRYAQLIPAILLYVVYSNFVMLSRSWVRDGNISHILGIWWIHGTMLLIGIWLNIREKTTARIWTLLKS